MSLKNTLIQSAWKLNPRFLAFAEKQMKNIPGVSQKIEGEYAEIMVELESSVKPYKNKFDSFTQIPAVGRDHADILRDMESMRDTGRIPLEGWLYFGRGVSRRPGAY